MAKVDDRLLVERCLAGDVRAFDAIFERHSSRVFNLLRRLCGNESIAEDLAQETFVTAYRSLCSWRGRGQFNSWLCGIAVRLYAGQRRRKSDSGDSLTEEGVPLPMDSDPLDLCTRAESVRRMESAIQALPDLYREVFVLVKVEGMSYREAAHLLEIPLGTAQSRIWKAMRIVQSNLADTPSSLPDSELVGCEVRS